MLASPPPSEIEIEPDTDTPAEIEPDTAVNTQLAPDTISGDSLVSFSPLGMDSGAEANDTDN
eukprot:7012785-Alexandrium_andersonii.AAC.1